MDLKELPLPLYNIFPRDLVPDETGLVALGGSLSEMTLIEAYSRGIFPWAGSHPIPWYSPDPRLVLYPGEFHISGSLAKIIKKNEFTVYFDNDFKSVIKKCATIKRKYQKSTWIDRNIIKSYTKLFQLGIAHCVEVHMDGELSGGLYGLALGNTFFGESMFSEKANGSKISLYHLIRKITSLGITLIDCQQSTAHMISLGAREISRAAFLRELENSMPVGMNIRKW